MIDKRYVPWLAGLGLVAGSFVPALAIHARDAEHEMTSEWRDTLLQNIMSEVKAGLAEGAVGMDKGADEMLRGADEMEAYAGRIENDPDFREREVARQNARNDKKITADELLASAPKLRRGADKMRAGARKMREGAEKMRRGESG